MDNPSELASVLSHSIEGLRKSAILLSPVIPSASKELLAGLGYTQEPSWPEVQDDHTITGMRMILDTVTSHGPRNPVFPRLEAVEAYQS
jgi:methionyl-tRNA synthetase